MIARFRPTYTYKELINAFLQNQDTGKRDLIKRLQSLYATRHVFLFNQGRSALYILLKALNVRGGVVSPAYNCIVVPDAIRFAGFDNQFVDISLDDYNMSPQLVEKAITAKSKVLLATHQFGIPCDIKAMKSIAKKKDLILIEDAAAAMGAKVGNQLVGTFGKAAFFSFQDTKVIGAHEGSCLVIHDDKIAEQVESFLEDLNLIDNGRLEILLKTVGYKTLTSLLLYEAVFKVWTKRAGTYTMAEKSKRRMPSNYINQINSFSASLVGFQVLGLNSNIRKRTHIAHEYLGKLKDLGGLELPKIDKGISPAWTRFPIRVREKRIFFEKSILQGVDLAWTFSYSCAEVYKEKDHFPNALAASRGVLNLPIYPNLVAHELSKVVKVIKNINE